MNSNVFLMFLFITDDIALKVYVISFSNVTFSGKILISKYIVEYKVLNGYIRSHKLFCKLLDDQCEIGFPSLVSHCTLVFVKISCPLFRNILLVLSFTRKHFRLRCICSIWPYFFYRLFFRKMFPKN